MKSTVLAVALACLCGCAASTSVPGGNWVAPGRPDLDLDVSKDACERETGDSKIPGFWLGYSRAFMRCMNARGWMTVGNPL